MKCTIEIKDKIQKLYDAIAVADESNYLLKKILQEEINSLEDKQCPKPWSLDVDYGNIYIESYDGQTICKMLNTGPNAELYTKLILFAPEMFMRLDNILKSKKSNIYIEQEIKEIQFLIHTIRSDKRCTPQL